MTKFTDEQIRQMKLDILGKKVIAFYYELDGDYFVMEFKDGNETTFRFMADLMD